MTLFGVFPILCSDLDSEGGNDPSTRLSPRSLGIKAMSRQGSVQSGSWPCLGRVIRFSPPWKAQNPV